MDQNNSPISAIARMRLSGQLIGRVKEQEAIDKAAPMAGMKLAVVAAAILKLLQEMGVNLNAGQREKEAFELEGGPEPVIEPRVPTAKFFDFDPNRKHGDRKKDNAAAMALLDSIDAGEVDADKLTDAQKEVLARYSGTGGNLVGADGKAGSAYEYYTPKPIVSGMWDLLGELGFKGGKVGDPCAATGIFGACAPANAAMDTIELNPTSGRVNQLVNGGPSYSATVSPFEAVASRTPDEIWDAVITNVPFGGVHDRGANRMMDDKYQNDPLETYFILRSLEKLKPGGLAAFIVPPRIVSAKGGREEALRISLSYMAEFLGAYRLPNSVFGTAEADTITDVIVLRKYGREALDKIAELTEQNPGVLVQANVQWTEFIGGDYFRGEGARFVLGTMGRAMGRFGEKDILTSDLSIAEIAKLMRKFPGSRVNWELLDATETEMIAYNEGDTITLAGQTLQMKDGQWVSLGAAPTDSRYDGLGQALTSPVAAVANGVDWEQASGYVQYLRGRSMDTQMPDWLRAAYADVQALQAGEKGAMWSALVAGLATVDVMKEHGGVGAFNYAEEYPVLHEVLPKVAGVARKAPPMWTRASKGALVKISTVYDRKRGYSDLWMGKGKADVMDGTVLDEGAKVDAIKYRTKGVELDVADLKAIYGEHFDPVADDDWCINADGTRATKADDYYVGNLGDFLGKIDAQIDAAPAGPLRDKLLRQKDLARERVNTVDPAALRFNLFSPFVTLEEKAEFLRRFAGPGFAVATNDNGRDYLIYEGEEKTTEQKLMTRIASYVTGNAGGGGARSLTLQGKSLGVSDKEALAMLRAMATQYNTQFDSYVKSNQLIMERLRQQANDPSRLYFNEVEDGSPLDVEGISPEWKLHGYQNSFVRQQGRHFGSHINGFDVGGGKTATAAVCIQYVQSIGVKKKTMVVVPNTVLSNWRKELVTGEGKPGEPGYKAPVYTSGDDCLFIGLDINPKTGKAVVDSGNYARDFMLVPENRHRKIFCTLEAFKAIPLRDETTQAYERYLMEVDPVYASSDKKADSERAESKRAEATSGTGAKSTAIPFFEDMGIDSLVLDEGHMFKNSKQTTEFKNAKFLSVAEASQRGMDVQIKAWYIRDLTPAGDGVLPLTATPLTNSPLEIYSMMTLAAGEKKVHDLCMGIQGADDFMNTMCVIDEEEEESIDGQLKNFKVFRGLQNVSLLRTALHAIATIKGPDDFRREGQNIVLPDAQEKATAVELPAPVKSKLEEYKMAYRAARALLAEEAPQPGEAEALARIQERFGESDELIAHPFNLINKMTMLIADPELDERATFYTFSKAQEETAQKVIASFNAKAFEEVRALPGPHTQADDVVGVKVVKDGDDKVSLNRIRVQARIISPGRIVVDTMVKKTQAEFEKFADKAGLDLDCSIPPKIAALLENVRKEEASPRTASGRVKQLIFCDVLPLHNKIKRLLVKHAGFNASQIVFITGVDIKNPEQMQGIQDGFNADGEDNKYRAVIANEKAEVGINLQKGTQAIHHLTIGWTPDSQIQRNGRGVRQGNTTKLVSVYHYDANGTFDEYKRKLTSKKNDWITSLMDKDGGDEIAISGGLTAQQYEEMIESMGDAGALQSIQERNELQERMARTASARAKQIIGLQMAVTQTEFASKFDKPEKWAAERVLALYDMRLVRASMERRRATTKNASSLIRLEAKMADMDARIRGLHADLSESIVFKSGGSKQTLDDLLRPSSSYSLPGKRLESVASNCKWGIESLKEGSPVHSEWASERDAALAMVDSAFKDFERIAASSDGAYPADVVQAMRDGQGVVIDGRVFCRGMFVRLSGKLAVITGKTHAYRYGSGYVSVQSIAGSKNAQVIMFGTPEYEAALNEAAEFDDAQTDVPPESVELLFGSIIPAVADRRKSPTLVTYPRKKFNLPAPLFRLAINPAAEGISEVLKSIGESQSSVVKSWSGAAFVADSTAGVVASSGGGSNDLVRAISEWAKANGKKVTVADLSYLLHDDAERSDSVAVWVREVSDSDWVSEEEAKSRFARCETEDDVLAECGRMVSEALPWLEMTGRDFGAVSPIMVRIARNNRSAFLARQVAAAAMAKAAAEAAALAGNQPAPVVVPAAVPAGGESKGDINARVWVKPGDSDTVRIYFNGVDSSLSAHIARPFVGGDASTEWFVSVDARKRGGYVSSAWMPRVKSDIEARITRVFGDSKPTFGELVKVAGGMPAAPAPVDLSAPGVGDAFGGVQPNASGLVGITGNTLAHKTAIKECASNVGGRASWNGRAVRWEVPAAAWVKLLETHPTAAKELQVVPC